MREKTAPHRPQVATKEFELQPTGTEQPSQRLNPERSPWEIPGEKELDPETQLLRGCLWVQVSDRCEKPPRGALLNQNSPQSTCQFYCLLHLMLVHKMGFSSKVPFWTLFTIFSFMFLFLKRMGVWARCFSKLCSKHPQLRLQLHPFPPTPHHPLIGCCLPLEDKSRLGRTDRPSALS